MGEETTLAPEAFTPHTLSLCVLGMDCAPLPMAVMSGPQHIVRRANPVFCALLNKPATALLHQPMGSLLPDETEWLKRMDEAHLSVAAAPITQLGGAEGLLESWSAGIWPVVDEGQPAGVMIQLTPAVKDAGLLVQANEALVQSLVRQHELTEMAETLAAQLQHEIASGRKAARNLAEKARLLDLTNDAIIVRDLDNKITWWNKGAEDFYGWPSEEVLGKDLHSLLHTKFSKPQEEVLSSLRRDGGYSGEVTQTARDGREIISHCRWVLDAQTKSILTSYTDITERKCAEEALRNSEDKYRSLFTSAPMAALVCGCDGTVLQYNQRAVELWGGHPADSDGCTNGAIKLWLANGEVVSEDQNPVLKAVCTGEPFTNVEMSIERPDGVRVPVVASFAPLAGVKGETTSVIASFFDITERRVMEDELVSRAAELARADRSKNEFLAMLAHELRNPLAPLGNALEILESLDVGEADREQALKIMGRQVKNMGRMIEDLLDVSRITEGKMQLRRQAVNLYTVLNSAVEQCRPGMAARGQMFQITLPDRTIFVDGDVTRLEQVFANLLTNASKYSGQGTDISVVVAILPEEQEGWVEIHVKDNGIGISAEVLPHVFELFVQEARGMDRAHGGLGIGLTIVQRLVHLHGGTVEAQSAGLGHGAQFIVTLPVLAGGAGQTVAPAGLTREPPLRMLIVDDNIDSARSMATVQSRRGHDTRIAYTGVHAVALAQEFLPEVVLLDIGLPGMNGYEVARHLRSMFALRNTFIVAMTGYGSDHDRELAKDAGFNEYLVKPVNLETLRDWLRHLPAISQGDSS